MPIINSKRIVLNDARVGVATAAAGLLPIGPAGRHTTTTVTVPPPSAARTSTPPSQVRRGPTIIAEPSAFLHPMGSIPQASIHLSPCCRFPYFQDCRSGAIVYEHLDIRSGVEEFLPAAMETSTLALVSPQVHLRGTENDFKMSCEVSKILSVRNRERTGLPSARLTSTASRRKAVVDGHW